MLEMTPVSGGRRLVLLCIVVGLLAMLAVAFAYRVTNPSLVVEAPRRGMMGQPAAPGEGMDPEVGRLMEHLRDNPHDVKALVHLTEHLINQQNWDAAEAFVRRAVVAAPSDPQPMYLLGVVQHNKGQHAEAAASLERVVQMKDEASVRYSLGVLYLYYLNDASKGVAHLTAGLHDEKASEPLKQSIRQELEKAPLPGGKPAGSAPGATSKK